MPASSTTTVWLHKAGMLSSINVTGYPLSKACWRENIRIYPQTLHSVIRSYIFIAVPFYLSIPNSFSKG
jgi:hypothetical protein